MHTPQFGGEGGSNHAGDNSCDATDACVSQPACPVLESIAQQDPFRAVLIGDGSVVSDSKGELHEISGWWREQVSESMMLDWSRVDRHEYLLDAATGKKKLDADGAPLIRHTLYPRVNFLSPLMVPPIGPDRDTYVSIVMFTLIPNKPGGGDNDYLINKGKCPTRSPLSGTEQRERQLRDQARVV